MNAAEEIRRRLKAEPFVPFRIRTSFGQVQEVTQPRLVMVADGEDTVYVGTPWVENPMIYDQVIPLSLPHITALEEIPVAVVT